MGKRERKNQNNKIILFPGLEKRLLEKGLESFQQKRYQESILFFEEAMEMEPENTDVHIGLVLAYYEAGELEKAKELANKMLQTGIGDYIQVMDLYLMILVQLHQYSEIAAMIEVLLEERRSRRRSLSISAECLSSAERWRLHRLKPRLKHLKWRNSRTGS